jgi:hypothetical protein
MQLVVARVAAAGVVASETSARASLEAARQSAEYRAISAETATATAAVERDSLALRLAITEAAIEKLRAAAASVEEAARETRPPRPRRRPLLEKQPRPPLVRRRPSRKRCRSWRAT